MAIESADGTGDEGANVVEVRASRNIFSKEYTRTKQIQLPIEREYEGTNFHASFAVCFLAVLMFVAPMAFLHKSAILAALVAVPFVSLFTFYAVQARSLNQIGSGRLIIGKAGFLDSRLGVDPVPWVSVAKTELFMRPRSSRVMGIFLSKRESATFPEPSPDYRRAFFLFMRRRDQLFIQLDTFRDGMDIADVIRILVDRNSAS